jgi:IS30 family transposase
MHQEIATVLVDLFCKSYSPWERGVNENLNGLIRQYITNRLWRNNHERIIEIQEKLNNRPRERFNFETPNYMFNQKSKKKKSKIKNLNAEKIKAKNKN